MSKPMNAREYRAHITSVKAQEATEIVTLKSGSVWELRRPDLFGYVMTGRVPQSLLNEGLAAWGKSGVAPKSDSLGDEDLADSLIFMRELVRETCVNPRIVLGASKDDEIDPSEMLPEDFTEIVTWAMMHQGVAGLAGLQSFRNGRPGATPGNRPNRKKQRVSRKQSAPVG